MSATVMILTALAVTSGIGWFFFRILGYIEGKPVLSRQLRWALSLPLGGGILALSVFTLRAAAGYQAHPLGEAACGLVFAALAACGVSALGMLKRRLRRTADPDFRAPALSAGKKAVPFPASREIQDIGA